MAALDVIYVAGSGRSGTTVLDRVLGTLEGVTSFNELYCLLTDGVVNNDNCACGARFNDCGFWREAIARSIDGPTHMARVRDLYERIDHMHVFPKIYTGLMGGKLRAEVDEYRDWLERLYVALADLAGTRILVDSSKVPTRALLLSRIPGIRVHVVHVVRDVRAVAYAWQKEKFNPAYQRMLPTYDALRTARFWYARNIFSELLAPCSASYTRVSYEAFCARPREVLPDLVRRLPPVADRELAFAADGSLDLQSFHSIGGNPDRFRNGPTQLRLDTAWVEKLRPPTRRALTLLGYPLLARYGYLGRFRPERLVAEA